MPIYQFHCDSCLGEFELIESFNESEKPHKCPICADSSAHKIPSVPNFRMTRIYDNAILGSEGLYGGKHGEHRELEEESEMVSKKREELKCKGELCDFVFEEGKYLPAPGERAKTLEEV